MQWHCTIATHRPIVFSDREEFESHMLKELKGKINNSQLATLVRRGAQPAAHAFDECPLCKAQPDDINTKDHLTHDLTINDPLPRHVAGHLKTLALMFLPPGDNPEEDETDGPGSSSTKKSSRSVDADSIFKSSLTFDDDVSSKEDHDYTEWIFLPREPYGGHIQDPTLDMFVSRQVDIDMEHAHLSEVERENFKEYKTNTTQGTKTMLEDELSCAIKDDFAEVQTGVADVQVGVAEWRVAHKGTVATPSLEPNSTVKANEDINRYRSRESAQLAIHK